MFFDFIKLERTKFFRSSYWQKSIAINVLMVLVALYFITIFIALGIGLYPILKKEFPEKDPLQLVNNAMLYWFLGDLLLRFFFQKLPAMHAKPLLVLPIKKSRIATFLLTKSIFSFFNLLPLLAAIPFGLILLKEGYPLTTVLTWVVFVIIATLLINFLNFIIESKSSDSDFSFLPLLAIVSIIYAVSYFDWLPLNLYLGSSIESILGNPILLLIPFAILFLTYKYNYNTLLKKLYLDEAVSSKSIKIEASDLSWTERLGSSAPFLQLDLRLIWRNKRSRSSVFILVLGLLYGLFFYPNPIYKEMPTLHMFVGIFVTGIFMINFGQFIPAWDSAYYKLLMSQNIVYKDYLNSKFNLLASSAVILFVLSIPYVYFGWNILAAHFAAMIYNVGVNSHVLLFAGSFNRKQIDLNQRAAFNYQGTGAVQWLLGIPLMAVPALIFYTVSAVSGNKIAWLSLVVLGLLGIFIHRRLMNFITEKYTDVKYEMIQAFSQES